MLSHCLTLEVEEIKNIEIIYYFELWSCFRFLDALQQKYLMGSKPHLGKS